MSLLKIFQYAYLVVAGLFLYEAIKAWNNEGRIDYMSLFFFALAVFLFFFRSKYRKRFEDRDKQ